MLNYCISAEVTECSKPLKEVHLGMLHSGADVPESNAFFSFFLCLLKELLLHSMFISVRPEKTKSTVLLQEEALCFPLDSGSSDEMKSLFSVTTVQGADGYCLCH